jgi:predicted HicB family RNase H-like nuclease
MTKTTTKNSKPIRVKKTYHQQLRILAAQNDVSITDIANEVIGNYLVLSRVKPLPTKEK